MQKYLFHTQTTYSNNRIPQYNDVIMNFYYPPCTKYFSVGGYRGGLYNKHRNKIFGEDKNVVFTLGHDLNS